MTFGKNDKFGWTLVVDVDELDHAIIVQLTSVASRSRDSPYLNIL